jgi:hypothetical protein
VEFVGSRLVQAEQLLTFGVQVVQVQKCAAVVAVFQETQGHGLVNVSA